MKIFILLSRVPYPLIKGDKLRAFNQIRELSRQHELYLCCLNDKKLHPEAIAHLQPYCKEIRIIRLSRLAILFNLLRTFLFTDLPLQVGYFYSKKAKRKVLAFVSSCQADHIYCQLIRTSEYVRHLTHLPKTLDYMDSLSSGMQRRSKKVPFYQQWLLTMETRRLKKYEHQVFNDFDHHTIISERDRELIVNYRNESIMIIENGVDRELFKPSRKPKKYDLLFTGNMSYPPNVECVQFLVSEIMPLIWKEKASVTLVIAGANPGRNLKKLASDKVIFTGWINDICEYYDTSRIFIAPMQIGSGLQNKLLEAMSMNLPCITSGLANKSLRAEEGREILIGRSPEEYASLVIQLLENDNKAAEIAGNGHAFVKRNFNWEKSVQKLNEIFEKK